MKKIVAFLLTFAIGVLAFDLFETKEPCLMKVSTPEQMLIDVPKYQTKIYSYEDAAPDKVGILKPFFDSFAADDKREYSGWFMPDEFKGMPEVWTILLDADTSENSEDEKLVWSAMVLTQNADGSSNDEDNFHSVQIKTVGNRLSFKTNKIRGIEYKFDGAFLANGVSFSNDEKVLRGTMQKMIKGKRVAKFTATFAYQEPHCYH